MQIAVSRSDPTRRWSQVSECEEGPRNVALDWALNILGDRWTLLVLDEIGSGASRFNDIQRHTGMPRDRLSLRLRRLEARAVICRRPYCDHPPRFEYSLTEMGRALGPSLRALQAWGVRYAPPGLEVADSAETPCS
ncbi:transcriptional regulator [Mycolicibacterium sp. CH28]|uniref:winged helix-turn-helix transcriptional regulator n=1 Tax=Mycolicibacterium sp. CH28 TaxID=2512237 RepID=UPI0010806D5A|nr:transcriptional regulator [Mycolicibacterium sp. CH28]